MVLKRIMVHNDRRINLKTYLVEFVYLIVYLIYLFICLFVTDAFQPTECENCIASSLASESTKQSPQQRSFDSSLFFHYKLKPSFKNLILRAQQSPSLRAQRDSFPYRFQGKFCCFVCFELLVENFFCLQLLIV